MLLAALLISSACAALVPFPIVRESQLPLSGKRVLVAAPRAVAAPLAAALIAAGARPLWSQCVVTEPLDEESLGKLDDALLRLTEYDLLLLLSRDAVDAIVQRGLLLSDSSEDVLRLMLRASDVEIAALGPAALHLSATLKLPAGAVPVDPTPDGLAAVLSALGTVRAGSRVLVPTYADTCAPEPPYCAYGLRAPASCALYVPVAHGSLARGRHYCAYAPRVPASGVPYIPRTVAPQVPTARMVAPLCDSPVVRACIERLRADGCEVELVEAYGQRAAAAEGLQAECDSLRGAAGAVDAVCLCSALDAQGLALVLGAEAQAAAAAPPPFVAAVADEAAEEAARALGWRAGLVVKAGSPQGEAEALVEGLEAHFGAGKLLF